MATIQDMLNALQNPKKTKGLEVSKETWRRIGNKDKFEELGLSGSELDEYLKEWMQYNPYNNL